VGWQKVAKAQNAVSIPYQPGTATVIGDGLRENGLGKRFKKRT
jgi:hypothetical protein